MKGHPNYQASDDLYDCKTPFAEIVTKLHHEFEEWQRVMKEFYKRCPRLQLLSNRQLLKLLFHLKEFLGRAPVRSDNFNPYLLECFPEIADRSLSLNNAIEEALGRSANLKDPLDASIAAIEYLQDNLQFVSLLEPEEGSNNAMVVKAFKFTESQMIRSLMYLFDYNIPR
jgi:hypothetical protein